jgi:hypothetical protein
MADDPNAKIRQNLLDDAKRNFQKQIHELVADVHQESLSIPNWETVKPAMRTIARLATLLGALSIRAEQQTDKVI